jgi:SRR1
MPHTNRKKKYSVSLDVDGKPSKQIHNKKYTHSKRELVETSDGWTQVASSGWKTAKTHTHNHLHTDGPGGPSPQVLDMSLEELREGYERHRKAWEDSQACAQLKAILAENKAASNRCMVDNVVCLGLGSLHTVSLVWRRTSCTQLAALETIREVLGK